jgi:spermidine synthase
VIPFELVDTAEVPGSGQLRLMRRGQDFSILFGPETLMGSRARGSEEALAVLGCQRMPNPQGRVLIGGLGMGFTLGAALATLPASATVVVAELVPKVVTWARGPLAHLFGGSLDDPRVTIETKDVHDVIAGATDGFDAILLDVDNGPDGMIHPANDRLYCNWGLRAAYAALRPGGVLAVWSAYADNAFVDRLEDTGFEVNEVTVRASGARKGARHTIWLAVRSSTRAQASIIETGNRRGKVAVARRRYAADAVRRSSSV